MRRIACLMLLGAALVACSSGSTNTGAQSTGGTAGASVSGGVNASGFCTYNGLSSNPFANSATDFTTAEGLASLYDNMKKYSELLDKAVDLSPVEIKADLKLYADLMHASLPAFAEVSVALKNANGDMTKIDPKAFSKLTTFGQQASSAQYQTAAQHIGQYFATNCK